MLCNDGPIKNTITRTHNGMENSQFRTWRFLTFKRLKFAYANACTVQTPQVVYLIGYVDNKDIYCIYKTFRIRSVLFSIKRCFFCIILYFSVQIIIVFFIINMRKFKYQDGPFDVKETLIFGVSAY